MENELPEGWCWASLASLTDRIGDVDHKMPSPVVSGISYISTKNFYGNDEIDFNAAKRISPEDYAALCRKIKPEYGDILLSRYGTVGEVRKVSTDIEFQASYSIAIVKTFSQPNLTDYLVYALRSAAVQSQIKRDIRASAQPDLGLEYIRRFEIPLAPLNEQNRIVAAIEQQFSRLDAAVTSLQHARAKLKRQRAAILKAAVEGTLTEGWRAQHPANETAEQLLQRILNEQQEKWEAEQLGKKKVYKKSEPPDTANLPELPEGWMWVSVGQVSYFVRYGTSAKTSENDTGTPVLRMGNIQGGALELSNLKYLPADHSEFPSLLLKDGDMLFNRTNSPELVGKSAVYHGNPPICSYASYLIVVRLMA